MKASTENHDTSNDYIKMFGDDVTVSIEKRNYYKKSIALAYNGKVGTCIIYIPAA